MYVTVLESGKNYSGFARVPIVLKRVTMSTVPGERGIVFYFFLRAGGEYPIGVIADMHISLSVSMTVNTGNKFKLEESSEELLKMKLKRIIFQLIRNNVYQLLPQT